MIRSAVGGGALINNLKTNTNSIHNDKLNQFDTINLKSTINTPSSSSSSSTSSNSTTNNVNTNKNSSSFMPSNISTPNGTDSKRQHCCPFCERSFTRPYRLNDHISFSHTDEVKIYRMNLFI